MENIHDFEAIFDILSQSYASHSVPSVTLIAQNRSKPFHILVSTLISLRTKDEVTLKVSGRLFNQVTDFKDILQLSEKELAELLYPAGFYKTKAKRLRQIAMILIEQYHGKIPQSIDKLLELPGVGRKTANLLLIHGFHQESICVDTHVHRISNRLGWINTKNADQTEFALKALLPRSYWRLCNDYLVSYGQLICKPLSPFCSKCQLQSVCPQIGVKKFR